MVHKLCVFGNFVLLYQNYPVQTVGIYWNVILIRLSNEFRAHQLVCIELYDWTFLQISHRLKRSLWVVKTKFIDILTFKLIYLPKIRSPWVHSSQGAAALHTPTQSLEHVRPTSVPLRDPLLWWHLQSQLLSLSPLVKVLLCHQIHYTDSHWISSQTDSVCAVIGWAVKLQVSLLSLLAGVG